MDKQPLLTHGDEAEDVVLSIENTFDITFDDKDFYKGMTFGDLCRSVDSKIKHQDTGGCTSQQAFYKVRDALVTLNISDKESIKPSTPLADILGKNRKKSANKLKSYLGIKFFMFEIPGYIGIPFTIICLISFVAMFFKSEFAWGFGTSLAILYIASKLTTNLIFKTVEDLVRHLVVYNYNDVRRNKDSYNKNEIDSVVKTLFLNICALDENELLPETVIL